MPAHPLSNGDEAAGHGDELIETLGQWCRRTHALMVVGTVHQLAPGIVGRRPRSPDRAARIDHSPSR